MDSHAIFRKTLILPVDPPVVWNALVEPYDIDNKNNWTISTPIGGFAMFGVQATMTAKLTKNGVT